MDGLRMSLLTVVVFVACCVPTAARSESTLLIDVLMLAEAAEGRDGNGRIGGNHRLGSRRFDLEPGFEA